MQIGRLIDHSIDYLDSVHLFTVRWASVLRHADNLIGDLMATIINHYAPVFFSSHVHTVVGIRSPLIIAPMPVSSIFWMLLAWIGIERTQPGWITVELRHTRNFKTAAKGSRIANYVWTQTMHVSNFNKAYIIDKNKKQLESCRTLGTPWQPSWKMCSVTTLFHSQYSFSVDKNS